MLAFALTLTLGAMVSGGTPAHDAINQWCPVMPDEETDPAITIEYRGKTVAFCCDRCLKKFKADSAKYEGWLPQFAVATDMPTTGGADGTGHAQVTGDANEHAHSDSGGREKVGDHADEDAAQSAGRHDHGGSDSDDEREPILGRLHPIIIHFPIAGMPLAFLGFLVWVRTGREAFARSDVVPLFAATLASIAAVITGNIAHDSMRFSKSLHVIVERHQYVSTTIMVMAICLTIIRLWRWKSLTGRWRWVYGGGLGVVCALLCYTGFLGGSLVFGPNHLAW